jgi:hypothetical protein
MKQFVIGQRIKLTLKGESIATRKGIIAWRKKYGETPITGVIDNIQDNRFKVKMDSTKFQHAIYGPGYNTFVRSDLESIETEDEHE